ncbi:nucleoside deaminase [Paenibacillus sp.]|uniref:nucleoside deaminase n=1 Tax=Paenibacillus sp. TaxID=58172 RepID=UPI002D65ED81|nr:nucleoside deaminase [Paenibacillus sp.]HZG58580.1 nucleoside deaminase [Paenibacillus sp.]
MGTEQERFMEEAIRLALRNVETGNGGPFGAVIVKDGRIVASGVNEVTKKSDPTAHAEVQAIRAACRTLGTFQLSDCDLYTSCEPCPMCIGAIYWARPRAVYFACTKEEAAAIAFDDQFIYEELAKPLEGRRLPMTRITPNEYRAPFDAWAEAVDKIEY